MYFNPRTPCGVRRCIRRSLSRRDNFNPRTPCGVRPEQRPIPSVPWHFNPRTPCGVRLRSSVIRSSGKKFQSTHPLRGATIVSFRITSLPRNFNPRTPCGVRQQNCRNIPGKFAQKLQNFCKAEQRAALPRVGQRESGCYFRPCAVRTSRGKPEHFRFASDNERALRSVARLCAEVLDAGFILVSKVIKA